MIEDVHAPYQTTTANCCTADAKWPTAELIGRAVFGRTIEDDFRYSPPKIKEVVRTPMHGQLYQHDQICTVAR